MTKKQKLLSLNNKALAAENELNKQLSAMGVLASEILGYEVVADLCAGSEIEFRTVDGNGYVDAFSTILIEDVLKEIDKKN